MARRIPPHILMKLGFASLVLASFARSYMARGGAPTPDLGDAGMGALYGVAIGCMLLGLRGGGLRRSGTHGGGC